MQETVTCQIIVSGDPEYVQTGYLISSTPSLQWRIDLDLLQCYPRLTLIVAVEYLPPGDEMGSSALPHPITQLHRQYALTARTGDEIRLPLYLMAAGGLAEVLFEIKRPGLAGIKAFAFDCQVVLGNFRVHQDIGQLGGKPRLSEPVILL